MEVSEEEVMKPDYNDKVGLKRTSLSLSSDTYLLEKARKLLRGNYRESSPSCSIDSPAWNAWLALRIQSSISPENGLGRQSQPRPLESGEAESSTSVINGCPQIEDVNKSFKDYQDVKYDVSKSRDAWLALRVPSSISPENGLEGQSQPRPLASGEGESSTSVINGSPQIEDVNKSFKGYQVVNCDVSKRRRTQPVWTARVSAQNGYQNRYREMPNSVAQKIQIEVQKRLHEQLQVQKKLQMRIETQGKYLQAIIEKVQKNLSLDINNPGNLEATRAQLSECDLALSSYI